MVLPYYLLTTASYLPICAVAFYAYSVWRRDEPADHFSKHLGVFGVLFALPLLMNFLWAFSFLTPTTADSMLINGVFHIIASAYILILIYQATRNRNLLYLLALFAVTLITLPYSFSHFFSSLLLMAHLLFLIVSLDIVVIRRYHMQFAGVIGTAYALTGIFFSTLVLLGEPYTSFWWFLLNPLLALQLFMFHMDKKHYSIISPQTIARRKPHVRHVMLGLLFLRYTLYIMAVSSVTLIATVSLHELGHALTAQYYGCGPTTIIYDLQNPPYTEITCSAAGTPLVLITAAGFAIVLAVSGIFLFTEGEFTTRLAELMTGFGFLIGYRDFLEMGLSRNIVTLIMLVSVLIILLAIIRFSLFYLSQQASPHSHSLDDTPYHEDRGRAGHAV